MLNAAYGSGAVDDARELIKLTTNRHYEGDTADWGVALGLACVYAIRGDNDEVYRRFARAREGKNLAWEPMLRDYACFDRFADDPEYLKTVKHFDDLRAMLRQRLPDTLASFGVSL